MFPIFILDGKTELPKDGTYYVLTQDGVFLSKDTGLIRAMVKVDRISFLQKIEARAELRLPKIPSELIVKPLLFFRRVFEAHHSEAGILLYYSKERNAYLVDAPKQVVSATAVDYEVQSQYDNGFNLVGTIHSHCDFGAFHSGVDVHDEKNFDGIHITIGRVDQPYFTISCTVVVNNNRFKIDPKDLIFGVEKVDFEPRDEIYRKRALGTKHDEFYDHGYQGGGWIDNFLFGGADILAGEKNYQTRETLYAPKTQFYDLVLPEGKDYRNYPFPKEWFDRVSKKVYIPTDKLAKNITDGTSVAVGHLPETA